MSTINAELAASCELKASDTLAIRAESEGLSVVDTCSLTSSTTSLNPDASRKLAPEYPNQGLNSRFCLRAAGAASAPIRVPGARLSRTAAILADGDLLQALSTQK